MSPPRPLSATAPALTPPSPPPPYPTASARLSQRPGGPSARTATLSPRASCFAPGASRLGDTDRPSQEGQIIVVSSAKEFFSPPFFFDVDVSVPVDSFLVPPAGLETTFCENGEGRVKTPRLQNGTQGRETTRAVSASEARVRRIPDGRHEPSLDWRACWRVLEGDQQQERETPLSVRAGRQTERGWCCVKEFQCILRCRGACAAAVACV